jgi:hypothetical protein
VTRPGLLPALLAAAVFALAGCGGDDDDGGDGGPSGDPAEEILADAGLEVCRSAEDQLAQSTVGDGLLVVRAFTVADDCAGSEESPNVVRVFQFSDRESVESGAAKAKEEYPRGVVMTSGALVVVVTGPDRNANATAVGDAYEGSTGEPVRTV